MTSLLSRRLFNGAIATGALAMAVPTARSQEKSGEYPSRAMKLVVPFTAGGGTDMVARLFARKISDYTGQAVVVENKPGANGIIAVNTVLQAPADGYTILLGSNSTLSTNAVLIKNLPYDPLKDFEPITVIARGPCVLIVPPDSPYKSVSDLVLDARKRPGVLNYGSPSLSYKLYTEWFNQIAGIKTTEIPFKGAPEILTAVAAKQVDFAVIDSSVAVPLIQGGKVRALMQTGNSPLSQLPGVPTAPDSGFSEYLAYNWVAASVAAKVPLNVREKIASLFLRASKDPEITAFYKGQSVELMMSTSNEMKKYQEEESRRWRRLADVAGIQAQ